MWARAGDASEFLAANPVGGRDGLAPHVLQTPLAHGFKRPVDGGFELGRAGQTVTVPVAELDQGSVRPWLREGGLNDPVKLLFERSGEQAVVALFFSEGFGGGASWGRLNGFGFARDACRQHRAEA